MKLVYSIVSSEKDSYLEQFFFSATSALEHNPNIEIILIVDSGTSQTLEGVRKAEASIANEVITVDLPENYSAKYRSRLLKTMVRSLVRGTILSVDVDTMITSRLDSIESEVSNFEECDVAAVADFNAPSFIDSPEYYYVCNLVKKAYSFPIDKETDYFNSGVVYSRDSNVALRFYAEWQNQYINGFERGVTFDQPAFAFVNYKMNHIIKELSASWNCQICACDVEQFTTAKIIHYFSGNGNLAVSKLNQKEFFRDTKKTGILNKNQLEIIYEPIKCFETKPKMITSSTDIDFQKTHVYRFCKRIQYTGIFSLMEKVLTMLSSLRLRVKRGSIG